MFAAVNTIIRRMGEAALAAMVAACVLVVSGLALLLTLVLAPPLRRFKG